MGELQSLSDLLGRLEEKCPLLVAVVRGTLTKSPAMTGELGKLLQYDESTFDEKDWLSGEEVIQEMIDIWRRPVRDLSEALHEFIEVQYGAQMKSFSEVVDKVYEKDYYSLAEHLHYAFPYVIRRKKTIVNLAKRAGLDVAHFLDVGVGPAVIFSEILLNESKWLGYGVDVSRQCLRHAMKVIAHRGISSRAWLIKADATRLPFEKGTFDIVVASELLEHVSNPEVALYQMHRVLRTAGYAVIGIPTNLPMVMHLSVFTGEQAVMDIITEAHFKIIEREVYPIFDNVTDLSMLCLKE